MKSKILPSGDEDPVLGETLGGGGSNSTAYCWKAGESNESVDAFLEFLGKINYSCIKDASKWFLDTASISITLTIDDLMMAMTIFVLFADNIKLLTASKSVDDDFIIVNTVCLFAFIVEFILNTWCKTTITSVYPLNFEGYTFTFFWFLDFIAILSMFPDIPFIAEPLGLGGISSSLSNTNRLSKAGRVVRLVRLVRLVKLYKIATERTKRAKQEEEMMEEVNAGRLKYEDALKQKELYNTRQSRLGEQLSESTTRRVVVLVLLMVCILPFFDVPVGNYAPSFSTKLLHEFNLDATIPTAAKQTVLDTYISGLLRTSDNRDALLRVTMSPFQSGTLVNYDEKIHALRSEAVDEHTYTEYSASYGTNVITSAIFSHKYLEEDNAIFSILTTLFIAILLVSGSLIFTADTQTMVIAPIERMMNMVEAVARDPLQPLSFDHSEAAGSGEYETRLLESTIEKITGLLRVGFGEAGAGIISSNLKVASGGNNSAAVNPLLPGVRIYAVIGFCDIHHFEDINQLLTTDVLIFVNSIAEIVHSRVHYWGGQCNKNLGNAFVILWRIGDELDVQLQSQGGGTGSVKSIAARKQSQKDGKSNKIVDLRRVPGVDKLADHALVGYLKIIAEINRDPKILAYRNEPRLTRNGTQKFKVSMGFGLHAGWAIEGAVGSIHKVDATYLSPHVNMAARLETSSRQYGVPILISQNAYDLFSNETQELCRKCDVVTVKGSEVPIGIYTYDALQDQMFAKKVIQIVEDGDEGLIELCPEELEAAKEREQKYEALGLPVPGDDESDDEDDIVYTGAMAAVARDDISFQRNNVDSQDLFELDTDLTVLRTHAMDADFLRIFNQGVADYLDGNWSGAKKQLEEATGIMKRLAPALGGDGPCLTLLDYIKEFGPEAPDWWKGFRPLTAK